MAEDGLPMDDTLKAKIIDVLERHHTMALATIRPDGFPQVTTVNYIHDGLALYFASDAASQKAGNIKLNEKVSLAITSETENFYRLYGLSMSGIASRLLDKEAAHKIALELFRRLPRSKRFVPQDAEQLAVFRVTPVAISLIDYAAGFGTSYLLEL
jgi:nitroimidazol reductase NimA-like FMN-containing flavoprotein (pyridoxamine 5'-phosphate oxidase superfamily)